MKWFVLNQKRKDLRIDRMLVLNQERKDLRIDRMLFLEPGKE